MELFEAYTKKDLRFTSNSKLATKVNEVSKDRGIESKILYFLGDTYINKLGDKGKYISMFNKELIKQANMLYGKRYGDSLVFIEKALRRASPTYNILLSTDEGMQKTDYLTWEKTDEGIVFTNLTRIPNGEKIVKEVIRKLGLKDMLWFSMPEEQERMYKYLGFYANPKSGSFVSFVRDAKGATVGDRSMLENEYSLVVDAIQKPNTTHVNPLLADEHYDYDLSDPDVRKGLFLGSEEYAKKGKEIVEDIASKYVKSKDVRSPASYKTLVKEFLAEIGESHPYVIAYVILATAESFGASRKELQSLEKELIDSTEDIID